MIANLENPPSTQPSVKPRRVLIVDDNIDAALPLQEILQEAGHQVLFAADPVTALEIARAFRPEVGILDIQLPIMDGYELSLHLRALPGMNGCQLIALTGYAQEHDRAQSRQAGFTHHLVKPTDPHLIARMISGEPAPSDPTPQ